MENVELMNLKGALIRTFKGSTVLITGHTGFKGGWLTVWLQSLGTKVIGYSLDPLTNPSFFHATNLSHRVIDLRGDILDFDRISRVINEHRPEFIFHLAAQPLVRYSYQYPRDTFHVNMMGTVNVLESIRLAQYPTVCVCITSDKCYENQEREYAYRENDSLGGHDPYSASKGAAEIIIASYRRSFFSSGQKNQTMQLSSARAGNIVGGGDWGEDRLVPDCIRALSTGNEIKIRNPKAVRPWQFVLEPLCGYLWLAMKMKKNPQLFADAWNFGPYYINAINVQTLTELIIHEWGSGKWVDASQMEDNNLHEACYLKLDITKAMSKLGWRPVYNIEEAIQKTIVWYKNYYNMNGDMYKFSLSQIETYMRDASKNP